MASIAGFPACRMEFDKQARLVRPAVVEELYTIITDERITDLLVLAHGWNNDMAEAAELYDELLRNIAALKAQVSGTGSRRFGVLAAFEPERDGTLVIQKLQHRPLKLLFDSEQDGNREAACEIPVSHRVADRGKRPPAGGRCM